MGLLQWVWKQTKVCSTSPCELHLPFHVEMLLLKMGNKGNNLRLLHGRFPPSLGNLLAIGKKSSQENRNYLRMWSQENKSKAKNTKDLPKLNQVLMLPLFIKFKLSYISINIRCINTEQRFYFEQILFYQSSSQLIAEVYCLQNTFNWHSAPKTSQKWDTHIQEW